MFDEQTAMLEINPPDTVRNNISEPFEYCNILFFPNVGGGKLKCYESKLNNLLLRIVGDKLMIKNSLHTFNNGNNYSDYTAFDIECTINHLKDILNNDFKNSRILKTSFSVNIEYELTKDFLGMLNHFDAKLMFPMVSYKPSVPYGKYINLSESKTKCYDKTLETSITHKEIIPAQIFRLEEVINRMRKIHKGKNSINLVTLNDYCDIHIQQQVKEHILRTFDKLTLTQMITPEQIINNNFSLNEWTIILRHQHPDLYRSLSPDMYRKDKSKYKQLQSKLTSSEVNLKDVRGRIEDKLTCLIETR